MSESWRVLRSTKGDRRMSMTDRAIGVVHRGAAYRSRTDDLLITNQLLYQLS